MNKPINVAFIASTLPIGGAERTWIDFIPYLDKSKFNATVITFKNRGAFGDEMENRGAKVIEKFMSSKKDISVLWRLTSWFKKNNVKVVYTLDHDDAIFWGRICAKLAGVPVCLTVNHCTNRRDHKNTINISDKFLMPLSDGVIATAEGSRDHLVEEGIPQDKVHLIINGVDIDGLLDKKKTTPVKRSDFDIPEDGKVVGIVATFKPEKAHADVFLPAAKLIVEKYPNAYFLLVGDGVERPRIDAKIKELGIEKNVRITGFRDDAADVLGILDINTLASYPRVETFSLAILESMAVGMPCVVTNVGSLDQMVFEGENGYVVPHTNPLAFAEAVVRILKDEKLAQTMGEKSKQIALEKFHRNRMTRDTEILFEKLLQQKGKLD